VGSTLLAPLQSTRASRRKTNAPLFPLFILHYQIIGAAGAGLFIGAMHGSAKTGASNAEPQPGMGINKATITNYLWL